jgi:hypothetical protein
MLGCGQIRGPKFGLGHSDVSTTMIYTHVLNVGGAGVRSPFDTMPEPHEPWSVREPVPGVYSAWTGRLGSTRDSTAWDSLR